MKSPWLFYSVNALVYWGFSCLGGVTFSLRWWVSRLAVYCILLIFLKILWRQMNESA